MKWRRDQSYHKPWPAGTATAIAKRFVACDTKALRENKPSYRRLSLRERALFRGAKGDNCFRARPKVQQTTIRDSSPSVCREPSMSVGAVMFEDQVRVPSDVFNLQKFREWAHSDGFPETGQISFIDGEIEIDKSPEELSSHNRVKRDLSTDLNV